MQFEKCRPVWACLTVFSVSIIKLHWQLITNSAVQGGTEGLRWETLKWETIVHWEISNLELCVICLWMLTENVYSMVYWLILLWKSRILSIKIFKQHADCVFSFCYYEYFYNQLPQVEYTVES